METRDQIPSGQPRDTIPLLNLFAFPAETSGRFVMMIVVAIALVWIVSFLAAFRLFQTLNYDPFQATGLNAHQEAIAAAQGTRDNILDLADEEIRVLALQLRDIHQHALTGSWLLIIPSLSSVGLFLLAAIIVYRLYPYAIRRRGNLQAIPQIAELNIHQFVQEQAALMDVHTSSLNIVAHDPYSIYGSGRIFGRYPRYQLQLESGLTLLLSNNRSLLRPIVLHELGHLVNRDIGFSYFSSAIWFVFTTFIGSLVVGLVIGSPLFLSREVLVTFPLLVSVGRLIIMPLIVWFIWRGVLQVREMYADWRVKLVCKDAEAELAVILRQEVMFRKQLPLWQQLRERYVHPTPEKRLAALQQPKQLFQIANDLPLMTGFMFAIVSVGVPFMILSILSFGSNFFEYLFWTMVATGLELPAPLSHWSFSGLLFSRIIFLLLIAMGILLLIAYLLSRTLGIQVQRETIANLAYNTSQFANYFGLLRPAGLLTFGMVVGLWLLSGSGWTRLSLLTISAILLWSIGATFMTWIWLAFTRSLTQLVIGSQGGISISPWPKRLVTTGSTLLFALLLPPVALSYFIIQVFGSSFPDFISQPIDPSTESVQFIIVTLVVLVMTALVTFCLAMFSLGIIYLLLRLRSLPICPKCREEIQSEKGQILVVGQNCKYCHAALAPWIFVP